MILGKKMYARYQDTIKLESEENALRRRESVYCEE